MDEEIILSGYCRAIDQSRMVTAEIYDGEKTADCAYPDCPYAPTCKIGQQLQAFFEAK